MTPQISTGPVVQKTSSISYEHIPFSEFASEKIKNPPVDINDFSLARKVSSDVTTQTVVGVTSTISTESNHENWTILNKKDLTSHINGKSKKHDKKTFVAYIYEETLEKIQKQGFYNHYDITAHHDSKFQINPQNFSSQKMCILKVHKTASDVLLFEYEKDTFLPVALSLNSLLSSDYWDLEALVDKVINNPQIKFYIKSHDYSREMRVADVNNPEDVKGIIQTVPHYNQNDEGNMEEIFASYILSQEQMNMLLAAKDYGYDWVDAFIPDNNPHFSVEEIKKINIFESTKLLAFCCDALEHNLNYQKAIAAKNPSAPEVVSAKSRYRR